MGYSVLIHRSDSIYDDSPADRYQFPRQYLERARASIGDWIVYLEPTKMRQSRGYFAIARVQDIVKDTHNHKMYFALIEPGSYLDFIRPVNFRDSEGPIESGLINELGKLSGRAQSAVRPISAKDFNRILEIGLDEDSPLLPRTESNSVVEGLSELQSEYIIEQSRDRIYQLSSRLLRDRIFRKIVLKAYDERCAVSGLKLINGGGRAEVDAAHIKPVQFMGPDVVNNGIALSGTAHWMFDRGLITLEDNLEILISRQVNDFETVRSFINKDGFARSPLKNVERPHPQFLRWHRENIFKQ